MVQRINKSNVKLEGRPNESMLMTEFAEYYIAHIKRSSVVS